LVQTIATICTGNICRSPTAAGALQLLAPGRDIFSAGLHALVGHSMDADSLAAARYFGIAPSQHVAQQLTAELGAKADILLVMENDHRREIGQRWPHLMGKTFLLGHFEGGKQILDPYKKGSMMHFHMAEQVLDSVRRWVSELGGNDGARNARGT